MPNDKMVRAELLSTNPGVFNGQPRKPMKVNDVAKSMGVEGVTKTQKIQKSEMK